MLGGLLAHRRQQESGLDIKGHLGTFHTLCTNPKELVAVLKCFWRCHFVLIFFFFKIGFFPVALTVLELTP